MLIVRNVGNDQRDAINIIKISNLHYRYSGTNSFQKNGSIIQAITQFIQKQRCEIIGIAYLKNSTDFREDINSSYIQLHKIFPIKKQIKDKISFFVFTNVDKQIFNLKSLQNSKASLKQAYKRQGITFIHSRSFNWISYPQNEQDIQQVQQLINTNEKAGQIFWNQWASLQQMLSQRNQYKCRFQQFQEYQNQYKNYFRSLLPKTMKQCKQTMNDIIELKFTTNNARSRNQSNEEQDKNGTKIPFLNLIKSNSLIGATLAASLGIFIIPLVLAEHNLKQNEQMINRVNNVCQQLAKTQLSSKLDNSLSQQEQLKLYQMPIKFINQIIVENILSNTSNYSKKSLIIQKTSLIQGVIVWIRSLSINQQKKLQQTQNQAQKQAQQQNQYKIIDIQLKEIGIQEKRQSLIKIQDKSFFSALFSKKQQYKTKIYEIQILQNHQYIVSLQIARPSKKIIAQMIRDAALRTFYS